MKRTFLIATVALYTMLSFQLFSQVAINTDGSDPNNTAILDLKSSGKGLLIPRIALTGTLDETTIASPVTSLLIYNTATAGASPNDVIPGYYYWNGMEWVKLITTTDSEIPFYIRNQTATDQDAGFRISGNGIFNGGNVGIGTTDPKSRLNVNGSATIGYNGAMGSSFGGNKNTLILCSEQSLGGLYDDHPVGLIYATHSGWSDRQLVFALSDSWDGYNTVRPVMELINDLTKVNHLHFRALIDSDWSGTINFENASGTMHSRYGVNFNEQYGYFRIGGGITEDQMRLYSNGDLYIQGNAGIGTTSPSEKLTIYSGAGSDAKTSIVAGGEDKDGILYFGTPFEGSLSNAYKTAIIAEGTGGWSKAKLHFCLNNNQSSNDKTYNASIADSKMTITPNGNVGIGTTSPAESAALDVSSTTKGMLVPRMTQTQRGSIPSPVAGLLIYQTDETSGYYYYSGSNWIGIAGAGQGAIPSSSLIDCDGNYYPTITIGNQVWMAENLRVTHYRNGDDIPNVTDNGAWSTLSTGAYCWYNNDQATYAKYGALYNWHTVNDSRGLCPQGWHVPTHAEWTTLTTYLGGTNVAGGKMKATSNLWMSPNTGATNSSTFSGLPGGFRNYDGTFNYIGDYGIWWSSTEFSSGSVWTRHLNYNAGYVSVFTNYKPDGFSVRCLRD